MRSVIAALLLAIGAGCVIDIDATAATGTVGTVSNNGTTAGARSTEKRAAERERVLLQQKLTALKKRIDGTETARSRAGDALASSEAAISEARRALHDLTLEQEQTRQRLAVLTAARRQQQEVLATRRKQLAQLLREQYIRGNEDRIKLLLSGDDPARIGRSLRYLGYVSQAQTQLIARLRATLATVEANQAETAAAKTELDANALQAQAQQRRLETENAAHARLVASLGQQLASQRVEAGKLQRDESRLGELVGQLGKLIEQQQKADALAREQRRVQLAEQAKKLQKAQRSRKLAPKATDRSPPAAIASGRIGRPDAGHDAKAINPTDAIDADEAPGVLVPKVPTGNELARLASVQEGTSNQAFARLRGRLSTPLKGEVVARFGSPREGGPASKGWLIRAAEGTPVHAVAAGRVVFADWLRGFGNLIIVDHGGQYLTIYGNNQAVLKHAGDQVFSGEAIASAGNTGGREQSGLYFEMRFQGRAFDPNGWVTSR